MAEPTTDIDGSHHHAESVFLDRPCTYCQVLELDDVQQGGRIQVAANGKAYVDFGERVRTIEEWKAENGETPVAAARALSFTKPEWNDRFDKPEVVPRKELKLDYKRTDALPSLSGLAATASKGCTFCQVLRHDLLTVWDSLNQNDGMRVVEAELAITEVLYKFEEFGSSDERPTEDPKVWLDALYVLFTIRRQDGADEYSIHYNFYTEPEDPCASWFNLGRRPVGNDPMSAASLNRMQQLIALSVQETPLEDTDFLPTRLLDLSPSDCSDLQLIIAAKDKDLLALEPLQRRYVALSYSWGSIEQAKSQLTTVSENLDGHRFGIKFEKLPQTIADAIQLCRALGIRYLWVDALCIIQDDPDDWTREAFRMSQVYLHSFITLCIIRGDSCLSGFLKPDHSPQTVKIRFKSRIDSAISGHLHLRMLCSPSSTLVKSSISSGRPVKNPEMPGDLDFSDQNWTKRAWTFQEDAISPRKLYFGDLMFHMTSGAIRKSADDSGLGHKTFFEENPSLRETLCSWYELISLYSRRLLTYEHDRLPAISALARTINERFPDQRYFAGLWELDLHRGLLWTTIGHMDFDEYYKLQSKTGYIAPSWSWACRSSITSDIWLSGPRHPSVIMSPEFVLQKADIVTEKLNPFGRVSQGRLFLEAKIVKLPVVAETGKPRVKRKDPPKFLGIVFSYTLWSEEDEYIAHLYLDWDYNGARVDEDENAPGPIDQLSMLLIASTSLDQYFMFKSYDIPNQEVMLGLLVRPVGEDGDYERLGIWYTEDRDLGGPKFWKDIPRQDVRLV